jgi:hypothetical protein
LQTVTVGGIPVDMEMHVAGIEMYNCVRVNGAVVEDLGNCLSHSLGAFYMSGSNDTKGKKW